MFKVTLQANKGERFSYQWQKDNQDIEGANQVAYEISNSGNYTVKVTHNGCSNVSKAIYIVISPILSTEPSSAENNLSVFPNPNNGTFKMEIPTDFKNGKVALFDMMGHALPLQQHDGYFQINTPAKGSYIINVSNGLKIVTTKILVE
ncbi:T9SS type A sorting domain-containing protein [Runella sp. MFBS21]|uniref:T9SS type A sorting domain-containing protein n=1 Tax=Runella sp. MFBS21 TaxID=3034018 RepID=UPI0023F8BFAF|nr:T9SS type A sorting domain-containing protein [Runella sp. MFBS21]MDF7817403.1 T9SS type A sorting domain-containing protein [Runella sp. MFBS21]